MMLKMLINAFLDLSKIDLMISASCCLDYKGQMDTCSLCFLVTQRLLSGCGGPARSPGPSTPTQLFQEYFAQNAGTALRTHTQARAHTHIHGRALCCNLELQRERLCHCTCQDRSMEGRLMEHTLTAPLGLRANVCTSRTKAAEMLLKRHNAVRMAEMDKHWL